MDKLTSFPEPVAATRAEVRPIRATRRARKRRIGPFQRVAFVALGFLIAVYGLNGLILGLFEPHGVESGSGGSFQGAEVELYETVTVGIQPFTVEAAGYVNMVADERSFYISDRLEGEAPRWVPTAYSHEYFHLIQRDLAEEAAGGKPSLLNPIRSYIYYFQLLRLNSDLEALMPPTAEELPVSAGLEASADCYAQPRGSAASPAYYEGVYIKGQLCSPGQVWIVDQMAKGDWPTAPTGADILPDVHVTDEAPGRSSAAESALAKTTSSEDPEG